MIFKYQSSPGRLFFEYDKAFPFCLMAVRRSAIVSSVFLSILGGRPAPVYPKEEDFCVL